MLTDIEVNAKDLAYSDFVAASAAAVCSRTLSASLQLEMMTHVGLRNLSYKHNI